MQGFFKFIFLLSVIVTGVELMLDRYDRAISDRYKLVRQTTFLIHFPHNT